MRLRKAWLLVASYVCYGLWSVPYLGLLVGSAAVNHFGAKWMIAGDRKRRGKVVIAGNLLLLGGFKYLGWVLGMFTSVASWFGSSLKLPIPEWALPLGLSFYVFESISYIVDLMRKRERIHSFWDFQLFIAFFPKLISGPILRAKEFLPQVENPSPLRLHDVRGALRQIALGLFLKLWIADSLSELVDMGFARSVSEQGAVDVWILGLLFGINVYIDFSAYTRLAIGSAKLLGIDLVENFDHPFISTNPPEFWSRWHMSLSRWVADYLFFPLAQPSGQQRRGGFAQRLRLMRAALVSMVIFGIWHGAGWKFLTWGAYHGVVVAVYHLVTYREGRPQVATPTLLTRLSSLGGWALTNALFVIGFVMARAANLSDAVALIGRAFRPFSFPARATQDFVLFRTAGVFLVILVVGLIAERMKKKQEEGAKLLPFSVPPGVVAVAEGIGLGLLLVLSLSEMVGRDVTFIYFRF